MDNITTVTRIYYIAKVGKKDKSVRFIKPSQYSGLFNESELKDNMSFTDVTVANQIIANLNNIYKLSGLEYYCYLVNIADNSTHTISNIPAEYAEVVREFLNPKPVEPTSTSTSESTSQSESTSTSTSTSTSM
ncbi:hypothetical protein [Macrococcus sp. DPC7161]|uniref:hypothetical protein n=1 Tax=Macrococcus sp. DPC7161 TaxID=2507060 RepID=UPI00100B4358|nr:hypothetical protein [Macrococcus sp. DPC7161]RXK19100.1 hypothetical protein ER639_01945 [Macrococcus sp. DPC7161]